VGVHQGWQALTGERLARSQGLLEQAGQRVDIDPMISVAVEKPFGAMYSSVPMIALVPVRLVSATVRVMSKSTK
jgi:hypothetical protein